MESSRLFFIIMFLYTIVLSISSINCTEKNNNLVTNQAALFVFGDSLFDAGNLKYINSTSGFQSNFFPYGQTTFKFPTGRVSDGRLITDFIAENAWLPLIPPNLLPSNSHSQFTYGANFAFGGAGALVETLPGMEVYKMGGRKFGFLNMGAYECAPGISILDTTNIGSCSKPVAELIYLYNKKFPGALRRLQRELPGFRYALHDYHTSLLERINNPSKYGFKEGKMGCCGSGLLRGINTCGNQMRHSYELCENVTDYLFFDASHLTEKAHQQFAELMWSGPPNVTGPYNLKALFELN
ncbi:hypothetical protein Bca52824_017046 [Brassica carinata]|uniref:Uncharacterized protein n=1 Tax=Brassica carinata TaxID=52824 RepID=A0A8X7VMG0_BRACI|nr:hypothetical protein Bca52824_017046 [Brassica carinata]